MQREGVSWISIPWVVFVHVAAAFLFVMGHGASMWTSDQIRRERDPARIRALLELSSRSLGLVYGSLLTLLIAGIAAGVMGGCFGQGWIWAAIVVLVTIIVLMYALASRYYGQVREAVGMRGYQTPKDAPDPTPVSAEELAVLLVDYATAGCHRAGRRHRAADPALADDVQAVLSRRSADRHARAVAVTTARARRPGGDPRGL